MQQMAAAAAATATTSHYTTVEDEQDDLIVCVVEVRDDSDCLRVACLDVIRLASLECTLWEGFEWRIPEQANRTMQKITPNRKGALMQ